MTITIGHLYYDLLNLYGEIGNIKALEYHLENQGIKVIIKNLSIDDEIDFNKLDLIYIGSGTENNLKLAKEHLDKYKEKITKQIKNNKFFLITGSATNLFTDYENLNLKLIDKDKRITKEVTLKSNINNTTIYAFINRNGLITTKENNLFQEEGLKINNFYLTNLIGPLLVKNPKFLEYFIKQLIRSKNKNFEIKKLNLDLENKAYNNFIIFKKNKKNKF